MSSQTELEKWEEVSDDFVVIEQFMLDAGIEWVEEGMCTAQSLRDCLCNYFDIDYRKLDEERRALLSQ